MIYRRLRYDNFNIKSRDDMTNTLRKTGIMGKSHSTGFSLYRHIKFWY